MSDRVRSQVPESVLSAIVDSGLRPQIVHLVTNGVRGDSRVLKSAQASIGTGRSTLVVGITTNPHDEFFVVEDVPVLLVPYGPANGTSSKPLQRSEIYAWRKRGREISVFRAAKSAKAMRVRTSIWQLFQALKHESQQPRWSRHRPDALRINLAFVELLDAIVPEFVHVHDAFPLPSGIAYAARQRLRFRRRVQVMYDSHECVTELAKSDPASPYFAALASIETDYIRDASRVTTVSEQIAMLLTYVHGLRRVPLVVTNGPSSHRDVSAPDLRQQLGLGDEVPFAVYSGWVSAERGLGTVLRGMPSIPDLHLALVVNRQSRELVKALRLAKELGVLDRVHTAPYVSPSQITQYLSSADVGLIPRNSGRHLDLSLPTKFREYTHAGLPIVVSNNIAMADEIRRTGIGRVFRSGNVAGLVLQIERVLGNPDRYKRRITPALLEKYSWESQSEILSSIYRTTADPRGTNDQFELSRGLTSLVDKQQESSLDREKAPWSTANVEFFGAQLGIGRMGADGHARAWADAVSTEFNISASSFGAKNISATAPHETVRRHLNASQASFELGRITGNYTYLLLDGFNSVLGALLQGDLEREVDLLKPHMFGIGIIAHAQDVRDPDLHLQNVVGSYFKNVPGVRLEESRKTSLANREFLGRFPGAVFVSSPDLVAEIPNAHWLPVTTNVARWKALVPASFEARLHVLSYQGRHEQYGDAEPAIHDSLVALAQEGLIEYVNASEATSESLRQELTEQADIVVADIQTGSYGLAAVEAMAAGRVVIGNVASTVDRIVGDDVPIVDVDYETLESTIRMIANTERDELRLRASRGVQFASRWHSGTAAANSIRRHLFD